MDAEWCFWWQTNRENDNYLQVDISTLPEADAIQHATPTEEEIIVPGCSDESGHGGVWLHSDVNANEGCNTGIKKKKTKKKNDPPTTKAPKKYKYFLP